MGTGRILLIFPHGLAHCDSGAKSRYLQLVRYWGRRGFVVDQVGFPGIDATSRNQEDYSLEGIRHAYLFYKKKRNPNTRIFRKIASRWKKIFGSPKRVKKVIRDLAYPGVGAKIGLLAEENRYDYIVISYLYWHSLSSWIKGPAQKILMIEDLLSINTRRGNDTLYTVTSRLQDELAKINDYDLAIFVSSDEYNLCRMLLDRTKCVFVPPFMENNGECASGEKRWDILFVGSSNPHNTKGMEWFCDEVLPDLPRDMKVLLAGPIANRIKSEDRRIERIARFEKTEDIMPFARLAICPMLSGSGIKVKVVEALSFGIPVVTTFWGTIGLPSKTGNGCMVCESAQDMRECITALYRDKDRLLELGSQAKAFFKNTFEMKNVEMALDRVFACDEYDR